MNKGLFASKTTFMCSQVNTLFVQYHLGLTLAKTIKQKRSKANEWRITLQCSYAVCKCDTLFLNSFGQSLFANHWALSLLIPCQILKNKQCVPYRLKECFGRALYNHDIFKWFRHDDKTARQNFGTLIH